MYDDLNKTASWQFLAQPNLHRSGACWIFVSQAQTARHTDKSGIPISTNCVSSVVDQKMHIVNVSCPF